ncbi:MAG TPA: hypothetical protein VIL23_06170 [Clostridia bacterium]
MKKDPKWLDYMKDRHEERAENEEYFIKQTKEQSKKENKKP